MIVEFESRFAKSKQELICKLIAFAQLELFPHEDNVYINISAMRKQGVCGDCMYEDDNEFSIRLDKSLSPENLITTVLHELVHVSQYLRGMVMVNTLPYDKRPHEIEAYSKEKQLTEAFNGQS
tara:strand:- start:2812 stop:3180 length:369 start_codon:yes stop_codon:yes gene_type:complete